MVSIDSRELLNRKGRSQDGQVQDLEKGGRGSSVDKYSKTRNEMRQRIERALSEDRELVELLREAGRREKPGIQTFYRVCTLLLVDSDARELLKQAIRVLVQKKKLV